MNDKVFNDCVTGLNACFFLICSNIGLSVQDKLCIQHIYTKIQDSLSDCFMAKVNEG